MMTATSMEKIIKVKMININLGYDNNETKAIVNFCAEIARACDYDFDVMGEIMNGISKGWSTFTTKDGHEIVVY